MHISNVAYYSKYLREKEIAIKENEDQRLLFVGNLYENSARSSIKGFDLRCKSECEVIIFTAGSRQLST